MVIVPRTLAAQPVPRLRSVPTNGHNVCGRPMMSDIRFPASQPGCDNPVPVGPTILAGAIGAGTGGAGVLVDVGAVGVFEPHADRVTTETRTNPRTARSVAEVMFRRH